MANQEELLAFIEEVLQPLYDQQCQRAKKMAQRLRPGLTDEDLLNPDNFPEVIRDPDFMFEHGLSAGILAAKLALRSRVRG